MHTYACMAVSLVAFLYIKFIVSIDPVNDLLLIFIPDAPVFRYIGLITLLLEDQRQVYAPSKISVPTFYFKSRCILQFVQMEGLIEFQFKY